MKTAGWILLGWLALDCVLAPILGRIIRGPAGDEMSQQQPTDQHFEINGAVLPARVVGHHHGGMSK